MMIKIHTDAEADEIKAEIDVLMEFIDARIDEHGRPGLAYAAVVAFGAILKDASLEAARGPVQ